MIYTLRNGEPDLGKTREWQRFVAEEARLLASFGGRPSSTKRPAPPLGSKKPADVVARCAVRVGTNGSEGDLEGLARALRALAFDSKTARVYDAVVHVLPDAAKVLGAVAKL